MCRVDPDGSLIYARAVAVASQLGDVGAEPTGWHHARLIPTYGTRTQLEQEKRATSCLLSVMRGVPEFGHALLRGMGAPKSPVIETFTEVRLQDSEDKTVSLDGAIVCRRGSKTWTCLVEVKTGANKLKDDQVTGYLDVAREQWAFDGADDLHADHIERSTNRPLCSTPREAPDDVALGTSPGGGC